jgi:hypothetical protein
LGTKKHRRGPQRSKSGMEKHIHRNSATVPAHSGPSISILCDEWMKMRACAHKPEAPWARQREMARDSRPFCTKYKVILVTRGVIWGCIGRGAGPTVAGLSSQDKNGNKACDPRETGV